MANAEWAQVWERLLDAESATTQNMLQSLNDLEQNGEGEENGVPSVDELRHAAKSVAERMSDKLDICPEVFDKLASLVATNPTALTGTDITALTRAASENDAVRGKENVRVLEICAIVCQAGTDVAQEDIHLYAANCCKTDRTPAETVAAINFWCKCVSLGDPRQNPSTMLIAQALGKLFEADLCIRIW